MTARLLSFVSGVLLVLFAGVSGSANAGTCTVDFAATAFDPALTNSTSCGPGIGGNDNDINDVNTAITGTDLWTQIDKDEAAGSGGTGSLLSTGVNPASSSGTWGIDYSGPFNKFAIVMKDGSTTGTTDWFWFIVDTAMSCAATGNYFASAEFCGTWLMYGMPPGNGRADISHLTLYGTTVASTGVPSGSTGNVAEPQSSALALLGLALLGLGFRARRLAGGRR